MIVRAALGPSRIGASEHSDDDRPRTDDALGQRSASSFRHGLKTRTTPPPHLCPFPIPREQRNLSRTTPPRHLSRLHHHLPLVAAVCRARRHLDPRPRERRIANIAWTSERLAGTPRTIDAPAEQHRVPTRTARAAFLEPLMRTWPERWRPPLMANVWRGTAGAVGVSRRWRAEEEEKLEIERSGGGGMGGRLRLRVMREWASGGWSQRAMDAKLRVECRDRRRTAILTYMADGMTDREGKYRIEVDGEHDDEICESVLISSPKSVCATPLTGRDRSRVVLSHSNSVVSNKSIANNLGFQRVAAMDGCSEITRETQERSEKKKKKWSRQHFFLRWSEHPPLVIGPYDRLSIHDPLLLPKRSRMSSPRARLKSRRMVPWWGHPIEKFLVAGEKEIIHTKPFFLPVVSAAICTDHLLEVDQSFVQKVFWKATSVDTTWASVDTLSQIAQKVFWELSLVSTLPDPVSTLLV
ncbi:hypothetical protein Taro_023878 [Colocasia esculenta]|uniref:Uncharacterized protein n=1 Tax=Colocasia esculenta TaxID=4460 RepID=A0A843V5A7_COLES|nr:hypothetical protein [Colocasia esculenta]